MRQYGRVSSFGWHLAWVACRSGRSAPAPPRMPSVRSFVVGWSLAHCVVGFGLDEVQEHLRTEWERMFNMPWDHESVAADV